jgi:hypothetical protein
VLAAEGRSILEELIMARTQHLPLYQSVFIYTREVYRLRAGFQKAIKHDLGQEVCESAIKLLKCVVLANGSVKKDRFLNRLLWATP